MAEEDKSDGQPSTDPRGSDPTDLGLSVGGQVLLARVHDRVFKRKAPTVAVGRFVILETLGRGGAGVVYRAYDPKLDRAVAVKVLASAHASADQRMLREAKALAQLNHPNVVTIHEVDTDDDELFVAMEYVEGGTLSTWCGEHEEKTSGRAHALLELASHAIAGLAAAHDLDIVHRDVKPANMLVGKDGRLRIADFGLARPLDATQEEVPPQLAESHGAGGELTATGAAVGTPAYMSPEQFEGRADARSDQFGFCASFWEALYGTRPFEGDTALELLDAIENRRIRATASAGVPSYVRRILERGLDPSPAERFPNMRALGRALNRARARGRLLKGAGVAAIAIAAGAMVWAATQPDACTDDASIIDAAVGPDRRDSLRGALEASGVAFAGQTWALAEPRLVAIAETWRQQRLQACTEARDADAERAALGRRRTACLDQAVATLNESVDGAQSLNVSQASGFIDYVGVLTDIADCTDPSGAAFESDGGLELVAALHRARLAENAADLATATLALEEVLAQTEPGQLPRLRGSAHAGLSSLAESKGDHDGRRAHTIAALDEAEAVGAPDPIARRWTGVALLMRPPTPWASVEIVLGRVRRLERAGALSIDTRANFALAEATLQREHNRPAQALERIQEARALAAEAEFDRMGDILVELGYLLTMTGKLEEALAVAHESVALAEKEFGADHPRTALALIRVAEAQNFLARDPEQVATLDRAVEIFSAAEGYRPDLLGVTFQKRAAAKRVMGRNDEALVDIHEAIALLKTSDSLRDELGGAHEQLARILYNLKRHDDALQAVDTALALNDGQVAYLRAARASSMVLRAQLLAELDRDAEAVQQLEAARQPIDDAHAWSSVGHLVEIGEIAACYAMLELWDQAQATLGLYLDSERELDAISRGRLELTRARIYLGAKDRTAGAQWAARAEATMKKANAGPTDLQDVAHVLKAAAE